MSSALVFILLSGSLMYSATPRFFRWCDMRIAQRRCVRLDSHPINQYTSPSLIYQHQRVPQNSTSSLVDIGTLSAQSFEHLARLTRAHLPPRDALLTVLSNDDSHESRLLCHELSQGHPLLDIVQHSSSTRSDSPLRTLLGASLCGGVFVPTALEHCAASIRRAHRLTREVRVATAQAQLTMRVLTILPFVILAAALLFSVSARSIIVSPGMAAVIACGIGLNRLGSTWSNRHIRVVTRPHPDAEVIDLINFLHIQLLSGHTLHTACEAWRHINSLGATIASSISAGTPLVDAFHILKTRHSNFANEAVALITAALRDGQPVSSAVSTLSHEAQRIEFLRHEERIRQLPVVLTAPMVLCTLPSFILLTVAPMIVGQLSHLTYT